MFLTPRRFFFQHGAPLQKMFAYYFREFIPGNDPSLGGTTFFLASLFRFLFHRAFVVFHASELELLFGPVPNPIEDAFSQQMIEFYVNFVNDLDPGGGFTLLLHFLG